MSLLELKNIGKTYPDGTKAVRGVSFSIEKGEFVSIMGPSGSGKSTILHVAGFLDRQTSGTYHFDGKKLSDFSDDGLAHVRNTQMGFVFQMFNLLPRTSVLENVKLPLLYSEVPEDEWNTKAKKALDLVGLSHRLDHEPNQLSGGERQRVAIARALVNDPQLIFADEPTGNLDSVSGSMIMEELQKLNDAGKTVILITHETSTAEHANRVIHIRDGAVESDKVVRRRKAERGTLK
jgi:putative ABC transport system ATP-binding protein